MAPRIEIFALWNPFFPKRVPPAFLGGASMDTVLPNISVRLQCPVTLGYFDFDAPRDSRWLAAHWSRRSKVRCRECGSAHSYAFKGPVIESVMEGPRTDFAALATNDRPRRHAL